MKGVFTNNRQLDIIYSDGGWADESQEDYKRDNAGNKDLLELIDALEEYNQLLSDECSQLTAIASIHGWKSSRHKKGAELREKITKLKGSFAKR